MLKLLFYIFLVIMVFVVTLGMTIILLLTSGSGSKINGYWYEWTDFTQELFKLKEHPDVGKVKR